MTKVKELPKNTKPTCSPLARRLDRLAEAHGVDARMLSQCPGILEKAGLEPDDIDPDVALEAYLYHRACLGDIMLRAERL